MRTFKTEVGMIQIFLPVICLYFICFFCFSSVQTLLSKISSDSLPVDKREDIAFLAQQISSEMPIEKRGEWLNSFSCDSELIFVSAVIAEARIQEANDYNIKVSRSAPLSILLF